MRVWRAAWSRRMPARSPHSAPTGRSRSSWTSPPSPGAIVRWPEHMDAGDDVLGAEMQMHRQSVAQRLARRPPTSSTRRRGGWSANGGLGRSPSRRAPARGLRERRLRDSGHSARRRRRARRHGFARECRAPALRFAAGSTSIRSPIVDALPAATVPVTTMPMSGREKTRSIGWRNSLSAARRAAYAPPRRGRRGR